MNLTSGFDTEALRLAIMDVTKESIESGNMERNALAYVKMQDQIRDLFGSQFEKVYTSISEIADLLIERHKVSKTYTATVELTILFYFLEGVIDQLQNRISSGEEGEKVLGGGGIQRSAFSREQGRIRSRRLQ